MLRLVLAAVFLNVIAAELSNECFAGLQRLQGEKDMELLARCRASFSPELCKQAKQLLGPQPWSNRRMQASCSRLAIFYDGTNVRSLEAVVKTKASSSQMAGVDDAAAGKSASNLPATAESVKSEDQGPIADFAKWNKQKERPQEQGPGALATQIKPFKEARTGKELSEKVGMDRYNGKDLGPLPELFRDLETEPAKQEQPSSLSTMLIKMKQARAERKAKEKRGPDAPDSLRKVGGRTEDSGEAEKIAPVRLYGGSPLPKIAAPARGRQVLMACVPALLAVVALLFMTWRTRRSVGETFEYDVVKELYALD